MTAGRRQRKVRQGRVISDGMEKTVLVGIVETVQHPLYKKTIKRTKKLMAHDAENQSRVGDLVQLMETRPLSRGKRWRVVEVLEKAERDD